MLTNCAIELDPRQKSSMTTPLKTTTSSTDSRLIRLFNRLNLIRRHNDAEIVWFRLSSATIHSATERLNNSNRTDESFRTATGSENLFRTANGSEELI